MNQLEEKTTKGIRNTLHIIHWQNVVKRERTWEKNKSPSFDKTVPTNMILDIYFSFDTDTAKYNEFITVH